MGFKTYTCPIAKSCGGCEWLSVPYPIQLRRKRERVVDLFADIAPATDATTDTVGASSASSQKNERWCEIIGMEGEPLHYRHKAATPYAPGRHGSLRSGFYARGTHHIVACNECIVEDPRARKALSALTQAAQDLHLSAYQEDRGHGLLRHGIVRTGYATDECLLTLVTNGDHVGREPELVERIRSYARFITAISQNTNQRRTNAMLGSSTRTLYGPGHMRDVLLGCMFELGPTSFYQTNPEQTERLYARALAGAQLERGMRILDAYCGIGTIGLCAARATDGLEVIGIERGKEAVANAHVNARLNGLENSCQFICADATAYMSHNQHTLPAFDVAFMDPPRAGSTPEFLHGVAQLAPTRVVYISCNPDTQRRDIDIMLGSRYRLQSLCAVDMFPHTKHVETVAVLEHR